MSRMFLNVNSVNRRDFRNGNFPSDCTHVLRVSQNDVYQLFVGTKDDLLTFGAYIRAFICVNSVKLSLIEDYE